MTTPGEASYSSGDLSAAFTHMGGIGVGYGMATMPDGEQQQAIHLELEMDHKTILIVITPETTHRLLSGISDVAEMAGGQYRQAAETAMRYRKARYN